MATLHVYLYGRGIYPYGSKINGATTIQKAINDAAANDTILVHGKNDNTTPPSRIVYKENLHVEKPLTLTGKDGEWPVIDGGKNDNTRPDAPTVTITNNQGGIVLFEQFEVINGKSTTHGGGFFVVRGNSVIKNNCIHDNFAEIHGGGIGIVTPSTFAGGVTLNHIHKNTAASNGGGVYIYNYNVGASLNAIKQIRENIIGPGNQGNQGGGIYVESGNVLIKQNEIHHNHVFTAPTAARGGGLAVWQAGYSSFVHLLTSSSSLDANQVKLEWNHIHDNLSDEDGGAISAQYGGSIVCKDNTIEKNTAADDGGAAYATVLGRLRFIGGNNIFNNTAVNNGGGVHLTCQGRVEFTNKNILNNNTATNGSGGGIYVRNGELDVNGPLVIIKNKALNGSGGGIYALTWGFSITEFYYIPCEFDTRVEINGALIQENESGNEGGGISIHKINPETPVNPTSIIKSIIRDNKSHNSNYSGISMIVHDSFLGNFSPIIQKCLIENHSKSLSKVGIYLKGPASLFHNNAFFKVQENTIRNNDHGIYIVDVRGIFEKNSFELQKKNHFRVDDVWINFFHNNLTSPGLGAANRTSTGIIADDTLMGPVSKNNIEGHMDFGIYAHPSIGRLYAVDNWWGHTNGATEPGGPQQGDKVTSNVLWRPPSNQRHPFASLSLPNITIPTMRNPPQVTFSMPSEFFPNLECDTP